MFIYLIVNRITGKYYVGQHKGPDLKKYLRYKFSDARNYRGNSHLFNSMRKHPLPCDWSIHALLSEIQTKTELDQYERDFIAFLKSQDPEYGYNICKGGEGFTGPHSSEAKKKNSEASKRMWQNPEIRGKVIKSLQGHGFAPGAIDKIKTARAAQDEAIRLGAFNKWKQTVDPDHFKKIGASASREDKQRAGRMGSKEDKQLAGIKGAANGGPKARHVRWHVNRGMTSPECFLCQ